jgi:hypothetical protein
MSKPIEIDAQGITVSEFEEILCDKCHNAPLTYYCPACDYKVCGDCLLKAFKKMRDGRLKCRRCGNVDAMLGTLMGTDRL